MLPPPACPARADEAATRGVLTALASSDADEAGKALDRLLAAGTRGKRRAREALGDLLARRRKAVDAASRRLAGRFARVLDPKTSAALHARMDEHAKAGRQLVAYVLDSRRYPVPAKARRGWRPGKDYQPGQIPVEARTEIALTLFNRLEQDVVKAFGGMTAARPAGGLGLAEAYRTHALTEPKKPVPVLTYNLTDSLAAWTTIAAGIKRRHGDYSRARDLYRLARDLHRRTREPATRPAPVGGQVPVPASPAKPPATTRPAGDAAEPQPRALPATVEALACLLAGKAKAALELREGLSPIGRRWFDLVARRTILLHNARSAAAGSITEKRALREINFYRLACGLPPLVADPKLYKAAREHTLWQVRSRQVGHNRPQADMATVFHRCYAAGYKAPVCENIAGTHRATPLWAWRADAAHHRNLLLTDIYAAGLARSGRIITFNAGWLVENETLRRLLNAPSKRRRRR